MQEQDRKYFARLDHLRLLAVVMVISWHSLHSFDIVPTSYVPSSWMLSIFEEGHTGVALFMVLSGFIFHALCSGKEINYFEFIRNRVLRILPLFLVWSILPIYLDKADPVKLFIAIFGLMDNGAVPGAGWSVVTEFQFYLLFPFMLLFFRNYGAKYLIGLIALALMLRTGIWIEKGTVRNLGYLTLFGRIDQFALGMLGFALYQQRLKLLANPVFPLVIGAAWMYVWHKFNIGGGFDGSLSSPFWIFWPTAQGIAYMLLAVGYISMSVKIPAFLDRAMAYGGSLSYSLYCNHLLVIAAVYQLLYNYGWKPSGFAQAWAFTAMCLPPIVVMSLLTHYLIEKPFMSLRRSYIKKI